MPISAYLVKKKTQLYMSIIGEITHHYHSLKKCFLAPDMQHITKISDEIFNNLD
jgi:hypothetical protein